MRILDNKFERSGEKARFFLQEKVGKIQEHNNEVIEKKQLTQERRFQEWMIEQESFIRHSEKIEKKV